MLKQYLSKLFNRDTEVDALSKRIYAAHSIADPAEQVQTYGTLFDEATQALHRAKAPSRWVTGITGAVALGLEAAAFFTIGGPLMLAGIAVAAVGGYIARNIGLDSRDDIASLRTTAFSRENDLAVRLKPEDLEHSPGRETLLAKHPGLRDKFQVIAARGGNAASAPSIIRGPKTAPAR